ncbi:MAG: PQQ-binding-like beta-propeller repeat protein [Gammaproteobacteria bacterium]|nr:PQQ-binding-like beta-propeller repeat protein [Gammaproteobacteria bacterium]
MKLPSPLMSSSIVRKLVSLSTLAAILGLIPQLGLSQNLVTDDTVEWYTLGSDYAHTRYTPADEITANNFDELEVAWEWDGTSFNGYSGRSTPTYVDGKLFTVSGPRRNVVAIDPKTGETLWAFRLPNTGRWEYSMRASYGKGIAYSRINGKGVVYISTPGFFLVALDANTGAPLEGFGGQVPVPDFPESGVVDMLADLGHPYDPYEGIPLETGYITTSSPPIVVNDTIIVGNSAEQGYLQARIENVPGDILAYDRITGEFKWKFNVIPRPGEYGHETWENDAWQWTGDVSSWAPLTADPENNLVYVPTNPPTIDYYGGFRPGDGLFGTSVIALDTETGERRWHFQTVKHDVWNYDNPSPPIMLDLNIPGRGLVPAVAEVTKQGYVYTFDRMTGEPIWPMEYRDVPASQVPGEKLATTQPFPTKPPAFEMQGISEEDLIDFTPELRREALEVMANYQMGPLFNPPIHSDNAEGKISSAMCPGDGGGANIYAPPVADPTSGFLYVASSKACSWQRVVPGEEADTFIDEPTGSTFSQYANGPRSRPPRLASGLPYFKPPYSTITAYDMNTGEIAFQIPTGETPDRIRNNPALEGVDIGDTGSGGAVSMVATANLLVYSGVDHDGDTVLLYAVDKKTGEEVGRIEVPSRSRYGMSSWKHDGHQYIMLQTGAKLTAMALPAASEGSEAH